MKPYLLLLSSVLAATSVLAQSPVPSVLTGEDWLFPFTVTPHPRSGFFRDDNQFQATDQQPMEPFVHNIQYNAVDTHWGLLNPTEGDYDFTFIKNALERGTPHVRS